MVVCRLDLRGIAEPAGPLPGSFLACPSPKTAWGRDDFDCHLRPCAHDAVPAWPDVRAPPGALSLARSSPVPPPKQPGGGTTSALPACRSRPADDAGVAGGCWRDRRPRRALSLARSSPVPPPKQPGGGTTSPAMRPFAHAAAPAWRVCGAAMVLGGPPEPADDRRPHISPPSLCRCSPWSPRRRREGGLCAVVAAISIAHPPAPSLPRERPFSACRSGDARPQLRCALARARSNATGSARPTSTPTRWRR